MIEGLIIIAFFSLGMLVSNFFHKLEIKKPQPKPVWQVWVDDDKGNDHRVLHEFPSSVQQYEFHLGSYAVHEDFNVAKIAVIEYMQSGKISPYLTVVKAFK